MEGRDGAGGNATVEREAKEPHELPEEVQRVAPAPPPPPPPASSSSFANVQLRPEGQRYGDADLVPGGSLAGGGGGMLMSERNFPYPLHGRQGDPSSFPGSSSGGGDARRPGFGSADGYARFDPMFPGQRPPGGVGRGGGGGFAPRLPGEPDNDLFLPPGGLPGQPFGGPGGGQFGPRQGGFGGGGWGGGGGPQGGGNFSWR